MSEPAILLLGGPFGPFVRELGQSLSSHGLRVHRINLCGSDYFDWRPAHAHAYRRPASEWDAWVRLFLRDHAISDLVTFGDCHPFTRAALDAAADRGIRRHVFECGYFRPHWVTLERNGVNANSSLPRDPEFYRKEALRLRDHDRGFAPIGALLPFQVARAIASSVQFYAGWPVFPHYRWPFSHSALAQGGGHVLRALRLRFTNERRAAELARWEEDASPYFICYLQREGDSQILNHSRFASVADSYLAIMRHFAACAPEHCRLLIRNHPLDPGVVDHKRRVLELATELGIKRRLLFMDGGSLARFTARARGAITVNSTAGITSMEFGIPTKTLGSAFYDMPGLTHQGDLTDFWHEPQAPDAELFRCFHAVVMALTQVNGDFFAPKGRRLAVAESTKRILLRVAEGSNAVRTDKDLSSLEPNRPAAVRRDQSDSPRLNRSSASLRVR